MLDEVMAVCFLIKRLFGFLKLYLCVYIHTWCKMQKALYMQADTKMYVYVHQMYMQDHAVQTRITLWPEN